MNLKYFILVDYEMAGHHFDYAKNFATSIRDNDINIEFVTISNLTNKFNLIEWVPIIDGARHRTKVNISRTERFLLNIQWVIGDMPKFIKSIALHIDDDDFLFLEDFSLSELYAIVVSAVLSNKKKLSIGILFRYSIKDSHLKSILYTLLFLIVDLKFKRSLYFSDSNLLSDAWNKLLNKKVTTLPIPLNLEPLSDEKPRRIIWWPGSPREDKGLSRILEMLNRTQYISDVKFILSLDVKKYLTSSKVEINFIESILTTEMYINTFQMTQYVILPYKKNRYSESTSGIFVESILLGCIPIVEWGTWMAQELERFALMELIVDFEYFHLSDFIATVEKNFSNINNKLKSMQRSYKQFHKVDSYRNILFNEFSNAIK